MKTPGDVLSFWFGEPARDPESLKIKLKRWLGGGPELDATIKREFGAEIDAAIEGTLDAWLAEPKGWLALVILLDQFTRNAYRGDPKTHAGDARAVELTLEAIANGKLRLLPIQERHFAMMPLVHAEDNACQARFAEEHAAFLKEVPSELAPVYAAGTEQSQKYSAIIRRFGRFPHRNKLLGRESTPEEEAFLLDWFEKAPTKLAREMGIGSKSTGAQQMKAKNTICLWFDKDALEAARFYAATFPDSSVTAVHEAPSDYPNGKKGDVLMVELTVLGIPCLGLNGGPEFKHSEAFSFQIATDNQEETDRYWNAIVGNGGQESQCGWCKDRWGLSWQITPRVLMDAIAAGGAEAKRAFEAMMPMKKIDVATIEAARRG